MRNMTRRWSLFICLLVSFASLCACQNFEDGAAREKAVDIMQQLSGQNAFHVIQHNEFIIDGEMETGASNEIWQLGDNWAMTVHIDAPEGLPNRINSLFSNGEFYVQAQEDGAYQIPNSHTVTTRVALWAGALDGLTAEEITHAAAETTSDGAVITITLPVADENEAEMTAIFTLDQQETITSIVVKTAWSPTMDGQQHDVEQIQTTQFLSFDPDLVGEEIEARAERVVN